MHTSVLASSLSRFALSDEVPRLVPSLRTALGLSDDARLDNFWVVGDVDRERELYSCHFASTDVIRDLVVNGDAYDQHDREVILGMRGVVVRVFADGTARVVSRGFAYTPTLTVANDLDTHLVTEGRFAGFHRFTDSNGGVHHINFADRDTHSTLLSEGCVLRISKLDGEVFVTTNRRLKTDRSRWGNSKEFVRMYRDFGGPELETLFSYRFTSSNITHLFMPVDPNLQIASRFDIGLGHLLYLGSIRNDDSNTSTDIEQEPEMAWFDTFSAKGRLLRLSSTDADGQFVFPSCPPTTEETMGQQIVVPALLTFEGVKHILTFGSSRMSATQVAAWDVRLRPGEAVIVNYVDAETGANKIVRVCSLAHNWRTAVGNNKPNRYNQFVSYYSMVLSNYLKSLTPTYPEDTPLTTVFDGRQGCTYSYTQLFPRVATPTSEAMLTFAQALSANPTDLTTQIYEWAGLGLTTPAGVRRDPRDIEFSNIAVCMLMALPYSFILEVANYYPTFTEQRDRVIAYLGQNFYKFKGIHPPKGMAGRFVPGLVDHEESTQAHGREKLSDIAAFRDVRTGRLNFCGMTLVRLFNAAASFVAVRVSKGEHMRGGRALPTFAIGSDNLRNLINKEQGPSLYAILVGVSKYINFTPRVPTLEDDEVDAVATPVRRTPPTRRVTSPPRRLPMPRTVASTLPTEEDLVL